MPSITELLPAKLLETMPVSADDWAQTPVSVQSLVIGLVSGLQNLEVEATRVCEGAAQKPARHSKRKFW